eukprot:303410-Chlamydomonas_euryale.AAC.2
MPLPLLRPTCFCLGQCAHSTKNNVTSTLCETCVLCVPFVPRVSAVRVPQVKFLRELYAKHGGGAPLNSAVEL